MLSLFVFPKDIDYKNEEFVTNLLFFIQALKMFLYYENVCLYKKFLRLIISLHSSMLLGIQFQFIITSIVKYLF